ncbi:hypothetical protein [Methanocalculus sp.]|uniref:hypothetical protein n=1 Tax=Methanocalculus sp. TaxID=2004547 RepID=UPI00262D2156|nr:hypothetical protein [Methanocalculus sp.]MDG6251568.1 hypothetical protein [Methanocalculus sp.]
MDECMQKQYLERVPVEIRDAIQSISTDAVWAVFIAVTFEGESYFTELKDRFSANPREMDRILKKLVDGGLVARKVQKLEDIGDRRKVYYETTRFGRKLLYTLYDIALPPEEPAAIAAGTETGETKAKKPGTNTAFSTEMIRIQVSEEADYGRRGDVTPEKKSELRQSAPDRAFPDR